jgi:hypothetical protein
MDKTTPNMRFSMMLANDDRGIAFPARCHQNTRFYLIPAD